MSWSRRSVISALSVTPLGLAGCGRKVAAPPPAVARPAPVFSLADAIAGDWRPREERARDGWRHPLETLSFMGLKPGMTVVEVWPGAGWYTAILAPFLHHTGGRLIAACFDMATPQPAETVRLMDAYRHRLTSRPDVYGKVDVVGFGPRSGPIAPAGSVDLVLTFRNVHNWMAAGYPDKAFHDMAAVLKPGGRLGVEEHRAAPGSVQDPAAPTGYVTEAYVKALATEAGMALEASSEINANPKDSRDHPFGVWTLPPSRQSAPDGKPDNPLFNHTRYDSIGESDRMTLRFGRT